MKNGQSQLKQIRKKPVYHSLNKGVKTHVEKYRDALKKREAHIGAIIEREFEEFESIDKIQKNMYAREKRQQLKQARDQEKLRRSIQDPQSHLDS